MSSRLGFNSNQNRNNWKQNIISSLKTLSITEFCVSGMHNILNVKRNPQCIVEISLDRASLTSSEKCNTSHILQ